MSEQIHVVHICPNFYPAIAFGGPIFSTKMITDGIASLPDFSLEVLTSDAANPNTMERLKLLENPAAFPKGYLVRYCSTFYLSTFSPGWILRIWGKVRRADVVHLTGPYNIGNLLTLIACRFTRTPLVWSPRGGFQATAEWPEVPKRRLKIAFESLCSVVGPRQFILHATAQAEAATSVRNMPTAECKLIPNAIDIPETLPLRCWRPHGRLRLAYLGRIHPQKGIEMLLVALSQLPSRITLDIYGKGSSTYEKQLLDLTATLGVEKRVRFCGMVDGEAKTCAYTDCDLFVLPSLSENFGMVIAEALAHGTPVVTTVHAPWQGLQEERCGSWVAATPEDLKHAVLDLADADLEAMGLLGRNWMLREFSTVGMVRSFERLYRKLANQPDVLTDI